MSTAQPPVVVAVVEDDAPSRIALGRLLRAAGFEPALFESAEAYIDAAPMPTCVVVDVQLPGLSGIELQQQLRRRVVVDDRLGGDPTQQAVVRQVLGLRERRQAAERRAVPGVARALLVEAPGRRVVAVGS